jgi:beta-galactosidase
MPATGLLKLCDEMGFLVMDEAFDMWEGAKTKYDYARFFKEWYKKDVRSWIRRDRNHPCIFMWSIGNEIYDTHKDEHGVELTTMLRDEVSKHDPYRNAVTGIGSNYMPWQGAQNCADVLKYAGYN